MGVSHRTSHFSLLILHSVEPAPTPSPVKSPPPRGQTPSWAQPQATSTALQSATAGYSQQPGEYPQQLQPPHPPPSAFGAAPSGGTPSFQRSPPSAFAQPPVGPFGQPQQAQAPPQNHGGGGGGGGGSAPGAFGGPLVGAPGGPRLPPGQAIATPVPLGPNAPKVRHASARLRSESVRWHASLAVHPSFPFLTSSGSKTATLSGVLPVCSNSTGSGGATTVAGAVGCSAMNARPKS